jgi:hypothetical protein
VPLAEHGPFADLAAAQAAVDRWVAETGLVPLAGRQILAAEILGGRPVSIRIDAATLAFFDPDIRRTDFGGPR